MSELASMAASKITNNTSVQHQPLLQLHQQQPSQYQTQSQHNQPTISSPVLSIASSLISSDSSATNHQSSPDISAGTCTSTPQNQSPQTNDSLPQTPLQTTTQMPPPTSSSMTTLTDIDEINNTTTTITTTDTTTPISTTNADNDKIYATADNNTNDNNTLSITNTNSITNVTTNPLLPSPENDFRSTASVLEKLSMFEKLEQKQALNNNIVPANNVVASSNCSSGNIAKTLNTAETLFNRNNKTEEIYKTVGAATDKDPGK